MNRDNSEGVCSLTLPLRFTLQYSADDHWEGQKLFRRTRGKGWQKFGWLVTVVGFALTLLAWSRGWSIWIFCLAVTVLIVLEPVLLSRWVFNNQFRRQLHLHAPLDVTIDAECISSHNSFSTGSSRWEMLGPWVEDANTVLVLVKGSSIFYMFPKRQLSRDQIEDLRRLLQTHIRP